MTTFLRPIGYLFYVVSPNATTFEDPKDIPKYEAEVLPVIYLLIVLEFVMKILLRKPPRISEMITSNYIGAIHETTSFITEAFILVGYEWLYQYRVFDLPWDSPYTWWATFFFVDFCYYWVHRANHEVNLLWLAHQVHHSSEDYNLTIAGRVSFLQRAAYFGFYHPLALLGVPITSVMVHLAFNFLIQFWVHTEEIGKLGPLEWVFNTPSHHRVHHGANKWCLDKNYGSVFIIWDRIFGTFEEEKDEEEIVYGLVDQPQIMNGVWHELYYFKKIYEKAKSMSTWGDSLKAVFYGPGWFPGTPRLGDPDTFPDVKAPRNKYDPQIANWLLAYEIFHMFVVGWIMHVACLTGKVNSLSRISFVLFCFLSMGSCGALFDSWQWAPLLEAARCSLFVLYARVAPIANSVAMDATLQVIFGVSAFLWTLRSVMTLNAALKAATKVEGKTGVALKAAKVE